MAQEQLANLPNIAINKMAQEQLANLPNIAINKMAQEQLAISLLRPLSRAT